MCQLKILAGLGLNGLSNFIDFSAATRRNSGRYCVNLQPNPSTFKTRKALIAAVLQNIGSAAECSFDYQNAGEKKPLRKAAFGQAEAAWMTDRSINASGGTCAGRQSERP